MQIFCMKLASYIVINLYMAKILTNCVHILLYSALIPNFDQFCMVLPLDCLAWWYMHILRSNGKRNTLSNICMVQILYNCIQTLLYSALNLTWLLLNAHLRKVLTSIINTINVTNLHIIYVNELIYAYIAWKCNPWNQIYVCDYITTDRL